MIKSFQPGNSPFIVGVVVHPELEPSKIAPLIQATTVFLLEIKRRLPDTDVRVMLDVRTEVNLAIARATLGLEMSVDALVGAFAPEALGDQLSHPQLHCIEVAAEPGDPLVADILIRRASLLIACWDGSPSKLPNDTADQVYRFLGVAGDQSDSGDRIEISAVADDLEVTARLVAWVPILRSAQQASEAVGQACYLLFAGDNVLEVRSRCRRRWSADSPT